MHQTDFQTDDDSWYFRLAANNPNSYLNRRISESGPVVTFRMLVEPSFDLETVTVHRVRPTVSEWSSFEVRKPEKKVRKKKVVARAGVNANASTSGGSAAIVGSDTNCGGSKRRAENSTVDDDRYNAEGYVYNVCSKKFR